jgi:hypothetical protein
LIIGPASLGGAQPHGATGRVSTCSNAQYLRGTEDPGFHIRLKGPDILLASAHTRHGTTAAPDKCILNFHYRTE